MILDGWRPVNALHAAAHKSWDEVVDACAGDDAQRHELADSICRKLIYSENMREAWCALEKLERKSHSLKATQEWTADERFAYEFLSQCATVVMAYFFSVRLSRTKHATHYSGLADNAKNLIEAVSTDERLSDHVTQLTSISDAWGLGRDLLAQLDKYGIHIPDENTRDLIAYDLDKTARGVLLTPAILLSRIERSAKFIADQGPLVARPSEPTAPRTYLIRELSSYFKRRNVGAAHGVVAAVATAIFGGDTDPDLVRKIAGSPRKRQAKKGPQTGTKSRKSR